MIGLEENLGSIEFEGLRDESLKTKTHGVLSNIIFGFKNARDLLSFGRIGIVLCTLGLLIMVVTLSIIEGIDEFLKSLL